MPDPLTLTLAVLAVAASNALTWLAARRRYMSSSYRRRLAHLEDDRDQLLYALGGLTTAIHDPAHDLEKAVQDAQDAIDGRWTP